MILSTDALLVRIRKVRNEKHPELNTYQILANGKAIGYVTRWESYKWEIDSKYAPLLISDCESRKIAIQRITECYRESLRNN